VPEYKCVEHLTCYFFLLRACRPFDRADSARLGFRAWHGVESPNRRQFRFGLNEIYFKT
jgi:hypothetical protein